MAERAASAMDAHNKDVPNSRIVFNKYGKNGPHLTRVSEPPCPMAV